MIYRCYLLTAVFREKSEFVVARSINHGVRVVVLVYAYESGKKLTLVNVIFVTRVGKGFLYVGMMTTFVDYFVHYSVICTSKHLKPLHFRSIFLKFLLSSWASLWVENVTGKWLRRSKISKIKVTNMLGVYDYVMEKWPIKNIFSASSILSVLYKLRIQY